MPRADDKSPFEALREVSEHITTDVPYGCNMFGKTFNSNSKLVTRNISCGFLGYRKTTKIAFILEDGSNRTLRASAFKAVKSIFALKAASNPRSSNSQPAVVIGAGGGYLLSRSLVVDAKGGPDDGGGDINMDSTYLPSDGTISE